MGEDANTELYKDEVLYDIGENEVFYVDFTSDSKPIALVHNEGKSEYQPDSYYLLYKDEYLGPFEDVEYITSSYDNSKFMFIVTKNDKQYLYLGKEKLADEFDEISELYFSKDGNDYVYGARSRNKYYIFINGQKEYGPFEQIESIIFNSKDKFYFFAKIEGEWDLYINGQPQKLICQQIKYFLPIKAGPYEGEAFYCIKKDDRWYAFFTDGRSAGPFDSIHFHIRYSEKTGDFSYVVINNGKCHLYRNNKKIAGPFLFIDYINFTKDEKHLIYSVKDEENSYIYIDKNLATGPLNKLGFEAFLSDDGKAIYYSAFQNGMWAIGHTFLDDQDKVFHKDLTVPYKCNEVFHLLHLKEGNRILYTTSSSSSLNDRQYLYLQGSGSQGPFILLESIVTSSYDNTYSFSAKTEKGWFIYVDGKPIAGPFENGITCSFIESSGLFEFKFTPFEAPSKIDKMICIDGKVCLGFFNKRHNVAIYLKDGKIIKRSFIK